MTNAFAWLYYHITYVTDDIHKISMYFTFSFNYMFMLLLDNGLYSVVFILILIDNCQQNHENQEH